MLQCDVLVLPYQKRSHKERKGVVSRDQSWDMCFGRTRNQEEDSIKRRKLGIMMVEEQSWGTIMEDFGRDVPFFFSPIVDPERVELVACRRGIQLATEIGAGSWLWKSTLRRLSTRSTLRGGASWLYGHIVDEVKGLLQSFDEFMVKWVRRPANKVAHILVRDGCLNKLCKSWFQPSTYRWNVLAERCPRVILIEGNNNQKIHEHGSPNFHLVNGVQGGAWWTQLFSSPIKMCY